MSNVHVEFHLRRKRDGHVVAAYRESAPEVVAAAEILAGIALHETAAAGEPVAAGFDRAISQLH
jgi:hypothetical protein